MSRRCGGRTARGHEQRTRVRWHDQAARWLRPLEQGECAAARNGCEDGVAHAGGCASGQRAAASGAQGAASRASSNERSGSGTEQGAARATTCSVSTV
jgi:hypothetical protein